MATESINDFTADNDDNNNNKNLNDLIKQIQKSNEALGKKIQSLDAQLEEQKTLKFGKKLSNTLDSVKDSIGGVTESIKTTVNPKTYLGPILEPIEKLKQFDPKKIAGSLGGAIGGLFGKKKDDDGDDTRTDGEIIATKSSIELVSEHLKVGFVAVIESLEKIRGSVDEIKSFMIQKPSEGMSDELEKKEERKEQERNEERRHNELIDAYSKMGLSVDMGTADGGEGGIISRIFGEKISGMLDKVLAKIVPAGGVLAGLLSALGIKTDGGDGDERDRDRDRSRGGERRNRFALKGKLFAKMFGAVAAPLTLLEAALSGDPGQAAIDGAITGGLIGLPFGGPIGMMIGASLGAIVASGLAAGFKYKDQIIAAVSEGWGILTEKVSSIWSDISAGIEEKGVVGFAVDSLWNGFKSIFPNIASAVTPFWNDVILPRYEELKNSLMEKWNEIRQSIDEKGIVGFAVDSLWNGIKSMFDLGGTIIEPVWTPIKTKYEELKNSLMEKWNQINASIEERGFIGFVLDSIWSGVKSFIPSPVTEGVVSIWDAVKTKYDELKDIIMGAWDNVINDIKEKGVAGFIWEGVVGVTKGLFGKEGMDVTGNAKKMIDAVTAEPTTSTTSRRARRRNAESNTSPTTVERSESNPPSGISTSMMTNGNDEINRSIQMLGALIASTSLQSQNSSNNNIDQSSNVVNIGSIGIPGGMDTLIASSISMN